VASVYFLADAEATMTYRDVDDDATGRAVTRSEGLLVRATLAFELRDQAITAVRPEADAHVAAYSNFGDDADALWEVGEALTVIPGLELPDDWGHWERDQEQQIRIPEHDTVIELYWSRSDYWALSMVLDEEEVGMRCEYDVDAFVGGSREGFDLYPPYYIVTEGTDFALVNPVWSVPAWILSKLLHIPRHTSANL
jgi:hypothetical protein